MTRAARADRGSAGGARYTDAGAAAYGLLQELDRSGEIWGDAGVSRGRLAMLRLLATGGPQTMSELARARHTSRQGANRLAAALIERGWVASSENPNDRRAPLLELTDDGLKAYQRLSEHEAARLNELARGLDAAELRAAARVLELLRIRGAATPTPDPDES